MMTDIHIGSIRIRAENVTSAQGQQLGERVAALLTEQLSSGAGRRRAVGHLQTRVTAQDDATVEQLATQVVTAILEAM